MSMLAHIKKKNQHLYLFVDEHRTSWT